MMNQATADAREEGYWSQLNDVESSSYANVGDANPLVYDQKRWDDFVKNRKGSERETHRTERELEIERRLKTPVLLRYENTPLSEVVARIVRTGGDQHPSRSPRPEPGRRRIEHAGHDQSEQGNLAQELRST